LQPKGPDAVFKTGGQVCSRLITAASLCEKCVELDGKIEHYQRLASRMTDQAMLDGIKELIEQMKALKAALHPEQTG
jgi:hypothetical protein